MKDNLKRKNGGLHTVYARPKDGRPTAARGRGNVIALPAEIIRPSSQAASFGVLVLMLDRAPHAGSVEMIERRARLWRGNEAVFLAAEAAQVGRQAARLLPGLFYNPNEPLGTHTVWRSLLPWRVIVAVLRGQTCCWDPTLRLPQETAF